MIRNSDPSTAPTRHAPAASPGKTITIRAVNANYEREPLLHPYGFKGGAVTEGFHSVVLLESDAGIRRVGLSKQSVLWSDAAVATAHTEAGANALMFSVTEFALQRLVGASFTDPMQLLEDLLPEVHAYARRVTDNEHLRTTFVLNALVGIDNAAWLLYAAENGFRSFDEMIPAPYRPALSHRHPFVASLPTISYGTPVEQLRGIVDAGFFFMKIKIGQPGTQAEMLEKDKARIEAIHRTIGHLPTPHTESGRIPYYFDANGRYEDKRTLAALIEHARKIGALDQVVLIEEPFPEDYRVDVSDLGVTIAADESAHTEEDAQERIDLGYRAIALKPIAKTLSKTLKITRVAHEAGVPCFCADLTATPILIDWNKNVVARLAPYPGLGYQFIETNGHQNYPDWARLVSYHPRPDASWIHPRDGLYRLDDAFYAQSGGIFEESAHFAALVKPKA